MTFSRCSIWSVLLFAACGDQATPSPDDTTAPTTTASPPAGPRRVLPDEVVLTADEPATIYYTLDGSAPTTASPSGPSPLTVASPGAQVRFFAVDAADNAEAPREAAWTVEPLGPLAVRNLRAAAAGTDVTLTWEPPAGAVDVVIARVTTLAQPADGASLTPGDALGGGEVVFVGTATTTTATVPVGGHTFAAYARYPDDVYAEARYATTLAWTPQGGTLTVTSTGIAAVTSPDAFTIAARDVTPVVPLGPTAEPGFDVTLDLTSAAAGVLSNPALVLGDPQNGTVDPTGIALNAPWAGRRFWHFGPRPLAAGDTASRTVRVYVADGQTLTVPFDVTTSPAAYGFEWGEDGVQTRVADVVLGQEFDNPVAAPPRYRPAIAGTYTAGGVTPDGRFLVLGTRNLPRLNKLDLRTGELAAHLDVAIAEGTGALTHCALDPSGARTYCVLNDGMHAYADFTDTAALTAEVTTNNGRAAPTATGCALVEIDLATMTESRRLVFRAGDAGLVHRGRRVTLSPDGRQAAVVTSSHATNDETEVHLLDLSTWTERDADASTAGVQPLRLGAHRASGCTFSADQATLLCNGAYGNARPDDYDTFVTIDVADLAITPGEIDPGAGPTIRVGAQVALPDGSFLLLVRIRDEDAGRIDRWVPATGTREPYGDSVVASRAALVRGDELWLLGWRSIEVRDLATGALLRSMVREFANEHGALVTPS